MNFKAVVSAIAASATVAGKLIVSNQNYGRGFEAWLGWFVENSLWFCTTFAICFIAMAIWQKTSPVSFKSARTSFFNWWDKFLKDLND